jgi:hypothetical protein
MTATADLRDRRTLRRVNELIRESLAVGGYPDRIAFFCECADPGCYQPVWLTVAGYERARADGRVLHAPGHVASDVASMDERVA